MTAQQSDIDREVLPRWRPWGVAQRSGELDPVTSRAWFIHDDSLNDHAIAFGSDPGLYTAADLLAAAAVLGLDHAALPSAAEFVLQSTDAPLPAKRLARVVSRLERNLSDEDVNPTIGIGQLRHRVAKLRSILNREPRNAIRWVDLSLAHTVLGNGDAAKRAMLVALRLEEPNRFILRAAARLLVVRDDPDHAIALLNSEKNKLDDPWILSAEIATCNLAGKSSQHIKQARRIVEGGSMPPWHVSELASALASTEMHAGREKRAKKLMRIALQHPTENSIAQAEWFAEKGAFEVEPELLQEPLGFEARARHFAREAEFSEAVTNGLTWLGDQPFAMEPAAFTSYHAAIGTADFEKSALAAEQGLRAHPNAELLLNNAAFAYLQLGDVESARDKLKRIRGRDSGPSVRAITKATRGLLSYREGRFEEGRRLYSDAVETCRDLREHESAALGAIYWALEEYRARQESAQEVLAYAGDLVRAAPTPTVRTCVKRAVEELKLQSPQRGEGRWMRISGG